MSELTPQEIAERGLIIRSLPQRGLLTHEHGQSALPPRIGERKISLIAHSACDGPDLCGENAPNRSGH